MDDFGFYHSLPSRPPKQPHGRHRSVRLGKRATGTSQLGRCQSTKTTASAQNVAEWEFGNGTALPAVSAGIARARATSSRTVRSSALAPTVELRGIEPRRVTRRIRRRLGRKEPGRRGSRSSRPDDRKTRGSRPDSMTTRIGSRFPRQPETHAPTILPDAQKE